MTGYWCSILSVEGHSSCRDRECDCPCHLPRDTGGDVARRPHSMPRETWERTPMRHKLTILRQRWLAERGLSRPRQT